MDPAVTLGLILNFVFQVSGTFINTSSICISLMIGNFDSLILACLRVNALKLCVMLKNATEKSSSSTSRENLCRLRMSLLSSSALLYRLVHSVGAEG